MKPITINFVLCSLCLLLNSYSHALDQSFFSIKNTKAQPISDNFFAPTDSIQFDSSKYQEFMYSSPDDREFSFQASALLTDDNEIDKLRAFFSYDGIILTTSSGTISGSFQATDDSYFPDQIPTITFFNNDTLLPSDRSFSGKAEFIGIGKASKNNVIIGFGYKRTVAPQLLDIDTNQSLLSPEGAYPTSAIDADGEVIIYGLWMRYDPLREAFEQVATNKKSIMKFFYFYDVIIGNFEYNPGSQVSQDYADATEATATANGYPGEGTTLKVSSKKSNFINMHATYGAGIHAIFTVKDTLVGLSAGFENSYSRLDDFGISTGSFTNDYAEGTLKGGTSNSSNGIFIRLAMTY